MKGKIGKIGRRGKIVLTLLVAVMFIGIASAQLLTHYGEVKTTVNVEQSLRLDGKVYKDGYPDITVADDIGTLVAGCKWGGCHNLHLHSQAINPVSTKVSSVVLPNDGGLTTMIAAEVQGAGADLGAYVPPSTGTEVAGTIQDAIDAASSSDVIVVPTGTYNEQVTINKPITLAAKDGQGTAIIDGAVQISSDDVVLTGFTINPNPILGENTCIYLGTTSGATLNNVEVSYNELDGTGVVGYLRGVLSVSGMTYSNILIENNKIHDLTTGIYTNPHTGKIDIKYNEIYNTVAGIGGFTGATVEYNVFYDNDEAIGADSSYQNAILRYNNFLGDEIVKDYGVTGTLDALNNWWGCDGIDISGNVNAGWNTWVHDNVITLDPNETVYFMIQYCTPDNAVGSYTSTVTFLPHP